jgi:hypothetical protein
MIRSLLAAMAALLIASPALAQTVMAMAPAAGGGSGTVTSITCNGGLSGGTITTSGTCAVVGPITNTANGAASAPADYLTGTIFSGGTSTTNFPLLFMQPTGTTASTTWSTAGTFLGVNAATGFAGNLADLQVAGASQFSVSSAGNVTANGALTGTSLTTTSGGVSIVNGACFTTATKTKTCSTQAGGLTVETTTSAVTVNFDQFGHQISGNSGSGAAPTCTGTPTGCAIVGTDSRMIVTTQTSATTSQGITFGHTWASTNPVCTATLVSATPSAVSISSVGLTAFTLNFASGSNLTIDVSCAQ